MKSKNLLLITADQWRGDCLSVVGHPTVDTPHLDMLAADAVVFRNHFTQCLPCAPSRASLYTGTYLQNHRVIENGVPLDHRHTNIALELKKAGYETVLVGYTDTAPDPRVYEPGDPELKNCKRILPGFDRYLGMSSLFLPDHWAKWLQERGYPIPENLSDLYYKPVERYPGIENRGKTFAPAPYPKELSDTAFLTDQAENYLRSSGERPWFLHLSYFKPHRPYLAPEPYNRMFHPDDVPQFKRAPTLSDEAKQHPFLAYLLDQGLKRGYYTADIFPRDELSMRQLRATYYGLMAEIDDNIGRIIALLKVIGQYENTVIIFLSDHGAQLGDHHLMMPEGYFDQSVHIPLIIRMPGDNNQRQKGAVIDNFTEIVDLLPTVLDILGVEIPRQCDGESLTPFLLGQTPATWRTEVHWEIDFRYIDKSAGYAPPSIALNISSDVCLFNVIRDENYKYVHFASLPPLLFNLKQDSNELHNLAPVSNYRDLILEYSQKLLVWRMMNDERTLTDTIVTPDGVVERPPNYR